MRWLHRENGIGSVHRIVLYGFAAAIGVFNCAACECEVILSPPDGFFL